MEKRIITDTYFSPLVQDYLKETRSLRPFYQYAPSKEGLEKAMRSRRFSMEQRTILQQVLTEQHQAIGKINAAVKENIAALHDSNTFTITTGHQICLLTGPLYFVFKIASVIKLAQEMRTRFPDKKFVPVYWAATEDHDFEEIQSVFLNKRKYTWQPQPTEEISGATGRMNTTGIDAFFSEIENAEGEKLSYNRIFQTFKQAWTKQTTLSGAIRKAVHDLFGHLGIVCIDADDSRLKAQCKHWIESELNSSFSYSVVKESSQDLHQLGYKTQIEPREINLFYLKDKLRERIIKEGDTWFVNNTDIQFNAETLQVELDTHPERFSPNVVLRPLYQESILPNIAYIGGPAEIAYWLQLKQVFEKADIDFPVLLPRDGFLFLNQNDYNRFEKLGFEAKDLLLPAEENLRNYVERSHGKKLSVEQEKQAIEALFMHLKQRYAAADNQAVASFSAIEKKLTRELEKLEKKAKRFAAKKETETAHFLQHLYQILFPGGSLAERKESIVEYAGLFGQEPIDNMVKEAEPLHFGLKVILY